MRRSRLADAVKAERKLPRSAAKLPFLLAAKSEAAKAFASCPVMPSDWSAPILATPNQKIALCAAMRSTPGEHMNAIVEDGIDALRSPAYHEAVSAEKAHRAMRMEARQTCEDIDHVEPEIIRNELVMREWLGAVVLMKKRITYFRRMNAPSKETTSLLEFLERAAAQKAADTWRRLCLGAGFNVTTIISKVEGSDLGVFVRAGAGLEVVVCREWLKLYAVGIESIEGGIVLDLPTKCQSDGVHAVMVTKPPTPAGRYYEGRLQIITRFIIRPATPGGTLVESFDTEADASKALKLFNQALEIRDNNDNNEQK